MMIWKVIRWSLGAIAVLGIGSAAAGYGLLHLPQLEGARSQVAARLLESYLGEAVSVTGPVALNFGQTIDVDVRGVVPVADTAGTASPEGSVRLSFASDAAWRGRLTLVGLGIAHIRVVVDAAARSSSGTGLGVSVAYAVQRTLSSPLLRNLEVEDLRILRVNDPAGWDGTLLFDRISARSTTGDGSIEVEARGRSNERAFSLSGSVPDLSAAFAKEGDDAVSLMLSVKGIEAELDGRLTETDHGLALAASLDLKSPSLGDLQELLQLARVAEGTGTLALELAGPLDRLPVQSAKLRIQGADGRVYSAEGTAADLWSFGGVDLRFQAALVPAGAAKTPSRFDFSPRSILGRIATRTDGFEIDDLHVETGLAAVQLRTIGPMRIGTIARDAQGRLRLEDIRLLQGDPKHPALDLTAQLDDAIALKGFSMNGRFALNLGPLLTGRQNTTNVGTLRGELAASDATGELELEALRGKLEGTELMSLTVRLAGPGETGKGPAVALKLGIRDLGRLASAIGRTASPGLAVAFDLVISAADGKARVGGSARVGQTDLVGRIAATAPRGKPEVNGSLHTQDLHLDDLISIRELSVLAPAPDLDPVQMRPDVRTATRISMDLSADRVEGEDGQASGLKAHLSYAQSRLQVSSLQVDYLGGRINADANADLAAAPPALTLDGTARQLSLERLFRRLGTAPPASGLLDIDLVAKTSGEDLKTLLASASGQLSVSLRDARLAKRTINLAGQHVISWAFTKTPDGGAPLLCFEASFDFKHGIGTTRQLIFETDKVQVIGRGTLNLQEDSLDLVFVPRAKQNDLIGKVRHVNVSGPMSSPRVTLAQGAIAAKVAGDTLGLPLHLLGSIVGADGRLPDRHSPCVVVTMNQ